MRAILFLFLCVSANAQVFLKGNVMVKGNAAFLNTSEAGGGGGGSPGFSRASNLSGGNSDSSLTWSHVCEGANRLLLVSAHTESSNILSVTFNGTSLTNVANVATGGSLYGSLWALVAPAATTANIVVTFVAAEPFTCAAAASFTNVNQTTPFGTPSTVSTTTAPVTNSISSLSTDLLFDVVSHGSTVAVTNGPSQTLVSQGTRFDNRVSMSTAAGTGSSVDMRWSYSSGWISSIAVALKP